MHTFVVLSQRPSWYISVQSGRYSCIKNEKSKVEMYKLPTFSPQHTGPSAAYGGSARQFQEATESVGRSASDSQVRKVKEGRRVFWMLFDDPTSTSPEAY